MQLKHQFKVLATIDQTWAALNDLELVASCFPGAAIESVEDDSFAGVVRLKLGPIVMRYVGSGVFVSRDADNYRASLEAKGRDRSGNGTANAAVSIVLTSQANGTEVEVATDLAITGRAAQFGSGVITEVSDRLLLEFVDRLSERLGTPPARSAGTEDAAAGTAVEGMATESESGHCRPARIRQPVETLDFSKFVWPALTQRIGPTVVAGLLALGLVVCACRLRRTNLRI